MRTHRIASGAALAAGLLFTPVAGHAQDLEACWFRGTTAQEAAARPSPAAAVAIPMGDEAAQICYHRPAARGRTVMGELVPLGQPWRLGANEAVQLHLPFAATVGSVALEPGVYSLYAVPGENEWEFMINSEYERWGFPITPETRATEVGSFTRPSAQIDEMVEQFTIRYEPHGDMMGHVVVEWEHTRVEFPVHHGNMSH